jgi:Fe-S-cluster containining protein
VQHYQQTIQLEMQPTPVPANPCSACTLGCCYRYDVNISGYDAWVIAHGLQLPPEQFLSIIVEPHPTVSSIKLDRSEVGYQLVLAKRPTLQAHQPCVFLIELPNGTGRCGIYNLRPQICRTYPAYLRNGIVGRRDDVLCPDDAWRDGILDAPIWYEQLISQFVEADIYELAVARWNFAVLQMPQLEAITPAGFYTYLLEFYDRLTPLRAGLPAAEWAAMCRAWDACIDHGVSPLLTERAEMQPWQATLDAIRAVGNSFFRKLTPQ